jgi:hypothetical protein
MPIEGAQVETVVIAAAALACPLGMLVMGWMMARGSRKSSGSDRLSVDDLRAEHRRLGDEIQRLESADTGPGNIPTAQR